MDLHLLKRCCVVAVVALLSGVSLVPYGYAFVWNGLEVAPTVSLQEKYDDNVTYVKENPVLDFITKIKGGLSVTDEGKTHALALDMNIAQEFFALNNSFNNTSEDMALSFKKDLSQRDRVTVKDSFTHAVDPYSFQAAFGRTSGRYFTFNNVFDMGYNRELSEHMTWDVRYGNNYTAYSNKDLSKSLLNRAGTGVDYALNSMNILSLSYDYYKRTFNPGSSATTNELALNFRHFLTNQLYFDLQTGVDFIDSFNAQRFTEPLLRASLTNIIDENTTTGIAFQKEYSTNSYSQNLLDLWRVSVNLTKQITKRVMALLTAFYGNSDYIGTDQREKLVGINIGCGYDVTQNSKLNLNYAFSQDTSTLVNNGYTKNVISLGFTIKF